MAKKRKYYVVWEGYTPGIYEDWTTTQQQIKGYPNAKYKSFKTMAEAESDYLGGYSDAIRVVGKSKPSVDIAHIAEIKHNSISVDAACSGNPGVMEYQGVETISGKQLFHVGPLPGGTNNVGEFLALIHALAYFEKKNDSKTIIYTDSRTGMAWLRNKKVKTTLDRTDRNKQVFVLLERAIKWMNTHDHRNPILKWDTANWGEIPADFGRK